MLGFLSAREGHEGTSVADGERTGAEGCACLPAGRECAEGKTFSDFPHLQRLQHFPMVEYSQGPLPFPSMERKGTIAWAVSIIVILVALGAADAFLTDAHIPESTGEPTEIAQQEPSSPTLPAPSPSSSSSALPLQPSEPAVVQSSTSSSQASVPIEPQPEPPVGIRPAQGPDVVQTIAAAQLTVGDTRETSIMSLLFPDTQISTLVLLKDNDRIGLLSWTESPRVKVQFLGLKEALHGSFSPAIADLIDETQQREGHPTVNLLTFRDTGISEERLAFVRVRERLYEFHIAQGQEDTVFALIDALTQ